VKLCISVSGEFTRKSGLIFFLREPKKVPAVPACVFNTHRPRFLNFNCGKETLTESQRRFLRSYFFKSFYEKAGPRLKAALRGYTSKGVRKLERLYESRALLEEILFVGSERFTLYASFFFLLLFGSERLAVSPYEKVPVRVGTQLLELELWEVLPAPFVFPAVLADLEAGLLKEQGTRFEANLLLSRLFTYGGYKKESEELKRLALFRGLLRRDANPSHTHGSFFTHPGKLRKERKSV